MSEPTEGRVLTRCHIGDCEESASYRAQLDWTSQPWVLLCIEHAADERGRWASVIKIEALSAPARTPS